MTLMNQKRFKLAHRELELLLFSFLNRPMMCRRLLDLSPHPTDFEMLRNCKQIFDRPRKSFPLRSDRRVYSFDVNAFKSRWIADVENSSSSPLSHLDSSVKWHSTILRAASSPACVGDHFSADERKRRIERNTCGPARLNCVMHFVLVN